MSVLVYSDRCKHCKDIINFIKSNESLSTSGTIHYHDVNKMGIPPKYKEKITSVPTMVTVNGKFLVGGEVKSWLASLIPNTVESHNAISTLGDQGGDYFDISAYGETLQPVLTPQLKEKIDASVSDGSTTYTV